MSDLAVEPEFWNNRRVFLTGHTGFKGAWLTYMLTQMGAKVQGYALNPPTEPSLFAAVELETCCDSCIADLADRKTLATALVDFAPEVVIHLGAQSLVRESYRDPVETFHTNVMGTVYLLEACRRIGSIRAIINVTTDKVYGDRNWEWGYRETDRLGSADPYSTSKACSELVTETWRKSFLTASMRIATARAGNVIGGGDWSADRLIADAARAFSCGDVLDVRMPSALRPWQHVLEPLEGYVRLARGLLEECSNLERSWNFSPAPDQVISVGEMATFFAAQWGNGAAWRADKADKDMKETEVLLLDSTLARRRLNWQPSLHVEETLRLTADWYKAYYQHSEVKILRRLMDQQITTIIGGR